jgi:hypothetical protein
VAADANLDDEFGGCGVGQSEVADHATHDREIRFGFRVCAGDGSLSADDEALRVCRYDRPAAISSPGYA